MAISKKGKVVLVVIVILGGVVAAWEFIKYEFIHRKVSKVVAEKTKGLYRIDYDTLFLDEASGTLHMTDIVISPDMDVYEQLEKRPPVLVKLHIPSLDVLGVKTPKALLNKQLEGRKIAITNPSIELLLGPTAHKDSTVYNPATDVTKQMLGKILKIAVDSVNLIHSNVIVRRMDRGTALDSGRVIVKAEDISCLLSRVLIDSNAIKDTSTILFARNLDMACKELVLPSRNRRYAIRLSELRFVSLENSMNIGRVKIEPQLSESDFVNSVPTQKDRYDFTLEDVRLVHLKRSGLWHKEILADSLVVGKSAFKIYRDLTRPADSTSKVGKYPQQQLMRMPIPINIPYVSFSNAFIEYKERGAKSENAGKLQFYHARAVITNVTNMRSAIARNNACVVNFRADLLGRIPSRAKLVLFLGDRRGRFTAEGNIGATEVEWLNPLTQPMGMAQLEKGHIHNLSFNFKGTDSSSEGRVLLLYNDLKISLLKKNRDEDDKYDKKKIASLMANFFVKNSNPSKGGGEPRVAQVRFVRITNKSFFNLIWKSIFTGIKESVGMK